MTKPLPLQQCSRLTTIANHATASHSQSNPFLVSCSQWRCEDVCRPEQTSVLPRLPIRSVLQSGYFFRIFDMGREPTLGDPSSSLSSHFLHSYPFSPFYPLISRPFPFLPFLPFLPLEVGRLNPATRSGTQAHSTESGAEPQPN